MDLQTYGMEYSDGDWCWIRQLAVGSGTVGGSPYQYPLPQKGYLVVRPHPDNFDQQPLGEAISWDWVWSMSGQYTLFTGRASDGYVMLSDILTDTVNYLQAVLMKTVSMACVKPATIGPLIWNDSGSGAKHDGSVWGIDGGDTGDWRPYVAQPNHDRPTNRPVYVLNMDVVEIIG